MGVGGHARPGRHSIRICPAEVHRISDDEVTRVVDGQPYRPLEDCGPAQVSCPVAERLLIAGALDTL